MSIENVTKYPIDNVPSLTNNDPIYKASMALTDYSITAKAFCKLYKTFPQYPICVISE